jgi:hypothetical protein
MNTVICLQDISLAPLISLLNRYHLEFEQVADGNAIPGSYWGDPEAGLIKNRLFARNDTPVHSILHEACHYICMDRQRRYRLDTNAGGDYDEENGVCYLQIILADHLEEVGIRRMMQDMDSWGYSFRLGSAENWFTRDAAEVRSWLVNHGILTGNGKPTGLLRDHTVSR